MDFRVFVGHPVYIFRIYPVAPGEATVVIEVLTGLCQGTPCCRRCNGCHKLHRHPRLVLRRRSPSVETLKQKRNSVTSRIPLEYSGGCKTSGDESWNSLLVWKQILLKSSKDVRRLRGIYFKKLNWYTCHREHYQNRLSLLNSSQTVNNVKSSIILFVLNSCTADSCPVLDYT